MQDMITFISSGVATAMKNSGAEAGQRKRKKDGVDDLDEEEPLLAVVLAGVDGVEDDGCTKLCWPARQLPPFTGTLEVFWRAQPMVVRPGSPGVLLHRLPEDGQRQHNHHPQGS